MKRPVGRAALTVAYLACLSICAVAWCLEGQPAKGLRIVSEQAVPIAPSQALTLRWASDQTLYLTRISHGVTEVALDGKLTPLRQPVPDRATLHAWLPSVERLAVSSQFFLVSSNTLDYGYRPRALDAAGTYQFSWLRVFSIGGMDLSGDRMLFLGDPTPRRLDTTLAPTGAIAWIGRLSSHPERDMKPFLYDVAGAPPKSLFNCMNLELGAVRFLADGSYVVVPGFQDGVYLYSPAGTLLHRWHNEAVGLDAPDCASLSLEQTQLFAGSYPARFEFLNRYRILDEIVPLAEGPGLLIRSVANGAAHWTLNVLHGDQVTTHAVPITGDLPFDRLRADARANRIAFLRTWHGFGANPTFRPGHLYIADLGAPANLVKEPAK
jgi:hypothetical protein